MRADAMRNGAASAPGSGSNTSNSNARSAAERANQPIVSSEAENMRAPSRLTRFQVGFMP